jgi:hypothetical protein
MASPQRIPREAYASGASPTQSKVPTSLGSRISPTGQELDLWTFAQLSQLPKQNLQTRALNLKAVLENVTWVPADFCKACRTKGETSDTIFWILQGQALLLQGLGHTVDATSFGWPAENGEAPREVFSGDLPSIKKTKETIMNDKKAYPKPGASMHDTPPSPHK